MRGQAKPARPIAVEFEHEKFTGEQRGILGSLSEAGLFVHTNLVPDRDTQVLVKFQIGQRTIQSWGKIIYVYRVGDGFKPQGFGVKFVRMFREDFEYLQETLAN